MSWILPYEGPVLHHPHPAHPGPQHRLWLWSESIITAAAELGWARWDGAAHTAHPRGGTRSGKELGDVHSLGKAAGERRLRSRGCAWRITSAPRRQGC